MCIQNFTRSAFLVVIMICAIPAISSTHDKNLDLSPFIGEWKRTGENNKSGICGDKKITIYDDVTDAKMALVIEGRQIEDAIDYTVNNSTDYDDLTRILNINGKAVIYKKAGTLFKSPSTTTTIRTAIRGNKLVQKIEVIERQFLNFYGKSRCEIHLQIDREDNLLLIEKKAQCKGYEAWTASCKFEKQ